MDISTLDEHASEIADESLLGVTPTPAEGMSYPSYDPEFDKMFRALALTQSLSGLINRTICSDVDKLNTRCNKVEDKLVYLKLN